MNEGKEEKKEDGFKPDNDDQLGSGFSSDSNFGKHSVATSYIQRNTIVNNLAAKAMEMSGQKSDEIDIVATVLLFTRDPKAAIAQILKTPIKKFLKTGLNTRNLQTTAVALSIALSV